MTGLVALDSLLPSIIAIAVAVGLLWVVLRLTTRAIARAAERMEQDGALDEGVAWARRLTRFVRHVFWGIAVLASAGVMLAGLGVEGLPRITTVGARELVLGPGVRLLLIGASAYLLVRAVHFLVESLQLGLAAQDADAASTDALERRKRVATIGQLLSVVATVVIVGVAVLMALSLVGVDIRPILAGAGIAGLAIGFGAQNLVRDVISGFFLILENQLRLGDVVSINGKSGAVEAVRLRTVVLRGLDGTVHVIPNGAITELSNMTKDFSFAVLDVGVAYKEDVDRVIDVLRQVAAELRADPAFASRILEGLDVLGVDAFADSAVVVKVRIKTVPIEQWAVAREFRRRIKIAFDARGIEIPFPHLAIYAGEASKPFAVAVRSADRDGV